MAKFKIALCFSDTGGGHRSAVEAIETGIHEVAASDARGHQFEIVTENIVENTHPLNRRFVDFYNYLLRHNQQAMQFYYWFINVLKPNDSEFGYRLCAPYLEKFLIDTEPNVVVSVHPMSNQFIARAMQETKLNQSSKLVTVVTDPNGDFWRGWACPSADLTIVPNELGREQLIAWGVPADRVRTLGMAVHPDFLKPPTTSKEEFRHHLGLHRDRLTVCINAGWAGGGNMMAIYRQLSQVPRPIQVVFLCGHNRSLYEKAKRAARKSDIPTAVLPFHDKMSDLMSAVDLMVTKSGGLTTFEAIAKRVPLALDMLTTPMPQELGTAKMLIQHGLAQGIESVQDVSKIVEELVPCSDRSLVKLPTALCLDRAGAIFDIVRSIMSYCDPLYQPNPEHRPAVERLTQ
jgi:UDP-N-acetylglucosamine:LPS N-acetylglucosamine transferase